MNNKDWLISFGSQSSLPKMRLICFPFAGGGVSNYARWRSDLHKDIELIAVNLPGRERLFNQPFITVYKQLIKGIASLLVQKSDCPLIFFGHSFGGLTAYFTALEIKQIAQMELVHLYVSARVPPSIEKINCLSQMPQDEFVSVISNRYQGIPQQILNNKDLFDLFIPIIKKDFELYEQYPQVFASYADPLVDCDITSISYSDDSNCEVDFLSWGNLTSKQHLQVQFPGGHFEILKDWRSIIDSINQCAFAK